MLSMILRFLQNNDNRHMRVSEYKNPLKIQRTQKSIIISLSVTFTFLRFERRDGGSSEAFR